MGQTGLTKMHLVINDPGKDQFAAGVDNRFYFPRKGILKRKNRMYFPLVKKDVSVNYPAFINNPGIFDQSVDHSIDFKQRWDFMPLSDIF